MTKESSNKMISQKEANDHLKEMVQAGKSDQDCLAYIKSCGAFILDSQEDIDDILRHTKGLIFVESYSGDDIIDP